jgi:hypothetical protein
MLQGNDGIVVVAQAEEVAGLSCTVNKESLAPKIMATIEKVNSGMRTVVAEAFEAGRLLIQAKQLCGHGKWLSWLGENVGISERIAQYYMKLARNSEKLEQSYPQRIADMTLGEAISLIEKQSPTHTDDSITSVAEVAPVAEVKPAEEVQPLADVKPAVASSP